MLWTQSATVAFCATVSASVSASLIGRGNVGEIGNGAVEFC
ncbi:hypothetical protein [Nostoc sp. DedQUE03]|nr:hypothetical protein [Nostoc sp. DedQUE02]